MTLDEFGRDLYECIRAASGLQHLRACGQSTPQSKIETIQAIVRKHLPKLSAEDAAEIARRYPVVLGL